MSKRKKNYSKKHLPIARKGRRLLRLYNATIFSNSSLDRDRFLIENVDALMIQQSSLENVSPCPLKTVTRKGLRKADYYLRSASPVTTTLYGACIVGMGLNTLRRVDCWLWNVWLWGRALMLSKSFGFEDKLWIWLQALILRPANLFMSASFDFKRGASRSSSEMVWKV